MSNINDVMGMFSQSNDQVNYEVTETSGSDFFAPKATKSTRSDKKFPVEFRILTDIETHNEPFTFKSSHSLIVEGEKMYVDSPCSAERKSKSTILTKTSNRWFFNKTNPDLKALADQIFYGGEKRICIVQVMKDTICGTYKKGDIKPFVTPKDVYEWVNSKTKLSKEDLADGKVPVNFIHPTEGCNIKAVLVNDPYTDPNTGVTRDSNKWTELEVQPKSGMLVKGKDGEFHPSTIKDEYTDAQKTAVYQAVADMYEESGVKLSDYAFKPFTPELEEKVKKALFILEASVVGAANVHSSLRLDADTEKALETQVSAASETTLSNDEAEAVNIITGGVTQAPVDDGIATAEDVKEESTETDDLPF